MLFCGEKGSWLFMENDSVKMLETVANRATLDSIYIIDISYFTAKLHETILYLLYFTNMTKFNIGPNQMGIVFRTPDEYYVFYQAQVC